MNTAEPWYLGQRAEALAMVLLTARDDLRIRQVNDAHGLDLVVELIQDGRATGRVLGIQLLARVEPVDIPDGSADIPDIAVLDTLRNTFPVCGFLFTMRDEHAYYYWLSEPVIAEEQGPKLRQPSTVTLRPLNRESLGELLQAVNRWYEALTVALAA